jgi:hypothetical protein
VLALKRTWGRFYESVRPYFADITLKKLSNGKASIMISLLIRALKIKDFFKTYIVVVVFE